MLNETSDTDDRLQTTAGRVGHESPASADDDAGVGPDGSARRCIVSGDSFQKSCLLRFVISPDGVVTPDIAQKLPGRGMYMQPSRALLDRAIAKRVFNKAARRTVTVPTGFADTVEALLRRRCIDDISLARRAGEAITGFEKAAAALRKGGAAVYVVAADAGEDGLAKLSKRASDTPIVSVLTRAELGSAFAREYAVHVVLASGGLAQKFQRDARQLTQFVQSVDAQQSNDGQGSTPNKHEVRGDR